MDEPQGFINPYTVPSVWKLLFNYKTISLFLILSLSLANVFQYKHIETLDAKLQLSITSEKIANERLDICIANSIEVNKKLNDISDSSVKLNLEMDSLKNRVEKFNKTNSFVLDKMNEKELQTTCEGAISELVDGIIK